MSLLARKRWRLWPADFSIFPPSLGSPYRLPFPAGKVYLCTQGNECFFSHYGWQRYSFDFYMPLGSAICAARAGTVFWVETAYNRRWFNAPNNGVAIDHGDGTAAWYLHIQQHGSLVKEGDAVNQGQLICHSGQVGISLGPHLHFHVTGPDGDTIPISFADVLGDKGVPRMGKRYRSGNGPRIHADERG